MIDLLNVGLLLSSEALRGAEGGRRTYRFSTCSQCVWLDFSCLWISISYTHVFWLCFGVATCFFMAVLGASLLHGLAWMFSSRVNMYLGHRCSQRGSGKEDGLS